MRRDKDYHPRLLDARIERVMAGLPAVMVVGPRACGKTTTARRLAATVVRLDREVEATPVRDDPDAVLADMEQPILLDEWQLVPEVLGTVKRAIDDGADAGSYLLTGSVRADLLKASWAATGRVVRLTQWGLTERELVGDRSAPSFFDLAFSGQLEALRPPPNPPNLRDYVEVALRGGYPEVALRDNGPIGQEWLNAYLDNLVLRDTAETGSHYDPVRLRRYLTAIAANTANVVDHKSLYDAAGIVHDTAVAYDDLLDLLYVTERLPAWHTNRLKRLTRRPKRYLTEPALLGPLLGVNTSAVLRDGNLLGRVIDTFLLAQLRPELEVTQRPPRLYHLRLDNQRRECDLLAEAPDGRVLAMEIKSSAAPTANDARHLAWLRDQLGAQLVAGVVFHTGPRPYSLGEGLHALPISCLWGHVV
jgi:predicted AAA+ superfamily ATPase